MKKLGVMLLMLVLAIGVFCGGNLSKASNVGNDGFITTTVDGSTSVPTEPGLCPVFGLTTNGDGGPIWDDGPGSQ